MSSTAGMLQRMVTTIDTLLMLVRLPFVERAYGASMLVAVAAALLGIFVGLSGHVIFW